MFKVTTDVPKLHMTIMPQLCWLPHHSSTLQGHCSLTLASCWGRRVDHMFLGHMATTRTQLPFRPFCLWAGTKLQMSDNLLLFAALTRTAQWCRSFWMLLKASAAICAKEMKWIALLCDHMVWFWKQQRYQNAIWLLETWQLLPSTQQSNLFQPSGKLQSPSKGK